jgi:hypothetical protein
VVPCIRNLNRRHFQVKTLAGHQFAFRGRTQNKNMEPKLFFVWCPRASCIVQEVISARKITTRYPVETNLIWLPARSPWRFLIWRCNFFGEFLYADFLFSVCRHVVRIKFIGLFGFSFTKISFFILAIMVGRDGSVGIATRYGLDGPVIESWWGRDFPHPSRPALEPTQPPYVGYRLFPEGKAAGAWRWPPTPSSAEVI